MFTSKSFITLRSLSLVLAVAALGLAATFSANGGLIPGSLAVTVVDSVTGDRILDATVAISPSTYNPLTENTDGVYVFPALLAGGYSITVTDPCHPLKTGYASVRDGEIASVIIYMTRYPLPNPPHTADTNSDGFISLSEEMRVIQFYNSAGYHCQAGTEDGYAPGTGSHSCTPHKSDYSPQNWVISLSEVLRLIQFYNSPGYHKQSGTEDGYAPNCALD